jgi:hypothetical protein
MGMCMSMCLCAREVMQQGIFSKLLFDLFCVMLSLHFFRYSGSHSTYLVAAVAVVAADVLSERLHEFRSRGQLLLYVLQIYIGFVQLLAQSL